MKRNKYKNKRCSYLGITFDSMLERNCYFILQEMERNQKIDKFEYQVSLPLFLKYKHIVDFLIFKNGKLIYMEAKGVDLALGKFKRKLAEHLHQIKRL